MSREIRFSLRFKEKWHARHVHRDRFRLPRKPLILLHIFWPRCTSTALIFMPFSDKLNVIMVSINESRDPLYFTIQRKVARATCAKWPVFRSQENGPVHDAARLPLSHSWADWAPTFRKARRWSLRCFAASGCSLFVGKKKSGTRDMCKMTCFFFTYNISLENGSLGNAWTNHTVMQKLKVGFVKNVREKDP